MGSEFVKLLTLRSIRLTLVAVTVGMPALAVLSVPSVRDALIRHDPALAPGTTPAVVGMDIVGFGQVAAIVLGVVAAGSEYHDGQISVSLMAVPHRVRLFAAKVATVSMLVGLIGAIAIPITGITAQCLLGSLSVIRYGEMDVLMRTWAAAVYGWVVLAMIGFALTVMVRRVPVPLFVMLVLSQLTLVVVHLVPIAAYLPFSAAVQLYDPASITAETPGAALSGVAAFVSLTCWLVAAVVMSGWAFAAKEIRHG